MPDWEYTTEVKCHLCNTVQPLRAPTLRKAVIEARSMGWHTEAPDPTIGGAPKICYCPDCKELFQKKTGYN